MTVSEFVNKVGFKVKDDDVKKVNNTIKDIKSTATKLLGAIGIGFSLVSLNKLAEEFNGINDQIRYATKGLGEQKDIQEKILKAANDTKTSYANMAGTVSKLVQTNKDLFPLEDAVEFSQLTQKLLLSAGKSEAEATSLQSTIAKTFQTGQVTSGVLKQLYNSAPEVINTVAQKMGVTNDKLYDLADAGVLTGKVLKESIMGAADDINSAFGELDYSISDALLYIRNSWGYWVDDMNSTLGLTQTIGKFMVSAFQKVIAVLNRVKTAVVWASEKVGGMQNLLKLVAITAGAIFLAMNFDKIINGFKTITKMLGGFNLKTMAIVAAIVLLFLIIDDFVNFMKGNDSLLGKMLEKAGIDCDAVRAKIVDVWNKIKGFLLEVWEGIKGAVEITWGAIKDFFSRHGESIKKNFMRYWNFIKDFLTTIWNILYQIISGVFGNQEDAVDGSQKSIKETIVDAWQKIIDTVSPILDALYEAVSAVFNAIMTVAEWILGIIKKIWDKWGKDIIKYLQAAWSGIKKIIDGFLSVVKGLANFIAGVFSGDWKKAWEGIKQVFEGIWNAIKGIVEIFIGWIQLAFKVCVDIIKAIWEKIVGFFQGIWDGIVAIFSAVGDWFRNIFQKAWDGIVAVWNAAVGWFKGIWDGIVGVFSVVSSWFSNIFTNAWNGIKNAFSAVTSWFKGIWDGIKGIFSGVGDWFKGIFSGALDGIKNVFGGIKDWFSNVFSKVKQVAVAPINGIISGLNVLIRGANKISFDVPDWVPVIGGKKFGFNLKEIPQLAKGGYVGRNKPRPVIIGDNKQEGEIVSPISKMRDTVIDALKRFASAGKPSPVTKMLTNTTSNRSVVQNVEINNEFNGDRAIQKEAAATMDKSAEDVTAQLARGLKFA